ncbi:hypothetical protein [Hyphomonas jannaschiana]|uniref:Uncharacterized protein n=1 Tax=Hyphomonas jannaschiana VP2 TaxID=1280952 RepID=A0A059FGF0_9PROT|nr:hypothetical protein [Hyphomonas jannaschiana]KCZ89730.1 hypothetical protein HJA_05747 [Hyphomonas jannaschiana VP2]
MTSTPHFNPHDAGTETAGHRSALSEINRQLQEEHRKRNSGWLTFAGFFALNSFSAYVTGGVAGLLFCSLMLAIPGYLALYRRGEISAWVLFALSLSNVLWAAASWAQRTSSFGSAVFFLSALFAMNFLGVAMTNRKLRQAAAG